MVFCPARQHGRHAQHFVSIYSALCSDALDLSCAILSSFVVVSPQQNLRKVAVPRVAAERRYATSQSRESRLTGSLCAHGTQMMVSPPLPHFMRAVAVHLRVPHPQPVWHAFAKIIRMLRMRRCRRLAEPSKVRPFPSTHPPLRTRRHY